MHINGELYFAPGILFSDVNVDSPEIVEKFRARMEAFYLSPAHELARRGHTFPAGVLLVSCLDAFARYDPANPEPRKKNRRRFTAWTRANIPSLTSHEMAQRFYEEFRCGLVHEARIKEGSAFWSEVPETVYELRGFLFVNPVSLGQELHDALQRLCERLNFDRPQLEQFQKYLKADFENEL